MATFPCTPAIGLAVCARLVRANIPFTLSVHSQHNAEVQCKFQDTLEAAVMQVDNEHRRIQATTDPVDLALRGSTPDRVRTARFPKVGDSALVSVHPLLGVVDVKHLNTWNGFATHQITFDNGNTWISVKLKYGYYIACSDDGVSWRADSIDEANVVKRPEAK